MAQRIRHSNGFVKNWLSSSWKFFRPKGRNKCGQQVFNRPLKTQNRRKGGSGWHMDQWMKNCVSLVFLGIMTIELRTVGVLVFACPCPYIYFFQVVYPRATESQYFKVKCLQILSDYAQNQQVHLCVILSFFNIKNCACPCLFSCLFSVGVSQIACQAMWL